MWNIDSIHNIQDLHYKYHFALLEFIGNVRKQPEISTCFTNEITKIVEIKCHNKYGNLPHCIDCWNNFGTINSDLGKKMFDTGVTCVLANGLICDDHWLLIVRAHVKHINYGQNSNEFAALSLLNSCTLHILMRPNEINVLCPVWIKFYVVVNA